MALKRTSSATHSPTAIPRASSDLAMTTRTSIQTPPPPLSSCMPATSLNTVSCVPKTSRWLPHIMPIEGSEASIGDRTVLYLLSVKILIRHCKVSFLDDLLFRNTLPAYS